jgi:predicted nucleic acid-binding protein
VLIYCRQCGGNLMAGPYTVDASVFLNAFNSSEAGHEISFELLARLRTEAVPIIVPTLVLPEVAGTIARGSGDPDLARSFAANLRQLPHLVLVSLDAEMAQHAGDVAARYRLRSSDSVYATVAMRFATTLVTMDQEQRTRVKPLLFTYLPAEVRM